MRTAAVGLILLAALAFVVGAFAAFSGATVVGRLPVTYWRGAIGLLLFAIALMLLERGRTTGP
jgi:hypothetical protein